MSTTATTAPSAISRRDIQFVLYEWLGLQREPEYDEILELSERIALERFAPHNATADANEPYVGDDGKVVLIPAVAEALATFAKAGLFGTALAEHVGGLGLPAVIGSASFAIFQAANVGTSGYIGLTIAAANMLVAHGSEEQCDTWVRPMIEGRYFGTMCLSEPQAGSSLADITTRAERQADGTYRLHGTKMWISGGEHELAENIVHMVLAKVPGGGPGTKGIGLFIVPRYLQSGQRNGVVLAGLNHKMGFRGTVNTVLSFEGAEGYLVGDESRGLAYMFHMMNEARISVGLGATAIGYAGYTRALRYAREREQGRPPGRKDPTSPQVAIIEHADVRRMLLASKAYVEGGLALGLYCCSLVDRQHTTDEAAERDRASLLLDVLTPIAKSWPSQWCLAANDLAIQVHGGYGYAREYLVEQLYRDNRLNPIHEGTTGVQALDLLGRKATMRDGAALGVLVEEITATLHAGIAAGGERARLGEQLQAAVVRLVEVTDSLRAVPDVELRLCNAVAYLEAVGHIVVAWHWLGQLEAAGSAEGDFYDGKRQAARYFFAHELPRVMPQLDLLAAVDSTVLDMAPEWF